MTICRQFLELRPAISQQLFRFLVVTTATIALMDHGFANVTGEGDVSPAGPTDLPIGGGTATADVIVGDDSFGRLTIDAPAFTDPLNSPNGFIGNMPFGVGQVTVSGFDLDQSAWDVDTLFTVGVFGQGFLDITTGGRISVGDDTGMQSVFTTGEIIIGDQLFSQGTVNVNGFASILETQTMTIGNLGFATLDVSNRGTLRSEFTRIGNEPDSIGRVTLTGLGTRWINSGTTNDDFVVGYEGRGTLGIFDQALATAAQDVIVGRDGGSRGTVRVSGQGSLWLIDDGSGSGGEDLDIGTSGVGEIFISAGGMIRASGTTTVGATSFVNLATGGVLNSGGVTLNGVIRGDGRIESELTIDGTGELRNAADATNLREYTYVTGEVTNGGLIESLGGEMEFESAVTNNFEIVARDAVMRFNGGLTNNGSLTLGGDTTIYGPVSNVGGGDIHVLSDSETLLVGDLTFSASSTLSLSIGDAPGTLDVLGLTDLGGAMLVLDYSAGVAAQEGDTYQILTSGDGLTGMFSNSQVGAGGLLWDIDIQSEAVFVTATALAVPTLAGDFDGDDDIDGFDFLSWQRGFGSSFGAGDLADWQAGYGTSPGPLAAATSAVPEPTSIALLMLGGVLAIGRRSRSAV